MDVALLTLWSKGVKRNTVNMRLIHRGEDKRCTTRWPKRSALGSCLQPKPQAGHGLGLFLDVRTGSFFLHALPPTSSLLAFLSLLSCPSPPSLPPLLLFLLYRFTALLTTALDCISPAPGGFSDPDGYQENTLYFCVKMYYWIKY